MPGDALYDRFAPYYDAFYLPVVDYAGDVEYLADALRRFSEVPVRRVLDLGCGTGEHAARLAKRGLEVDGVDVSAALVAQARRKAREAGLAERARFHVGDMARDVPEGRWDAAVSMFAAFCYLVTDEEAGACLDLLRARLPAGGLFVFEFWSTRGWAPRSARSEVDLGQGRRLVRATHPEATAPGGVYRFRFEHVVYEGQHEMERHDEEHALRLRTPGETAALLGARGFDVVAFTKGAREGKSFEAPAEDEFRVMAIARRR